MNKNSNTNKDELKFNVTSLLNSINHWVNFERLNKRKNLFSEKYLCNPIGQFLQSRYHSYVKIEKSFNFLLKENWAGKIDYCVIENKMPVVAIETKWIRNEPQKSNIFRIPRDIFRLSILKNRYNDCCCLFILVGKESELKSSLKILNDLSNKAVGLKMFPSRGYFKCSIKSLRSKNGKNIFEKSISGLNDKEFPNSIGVKYRKTTASTESSTAITVMAWEIY